MTDPKQNPITDGEEPYSEGAEETGGQPMPPAAKECRGCFGAWRGTFRSSCGPPGGGGGPATIRATDGAPSRRAAATRWGSPCVVVALSRDDGGSANARLVRAGWPGAYQCSSPDRGGRTKGSGWKKPVPGPAEFHRVWRPARAVLWFDQRGHGQKGTLPPSKAGAGITTTWSLTPVLSLATCARGCQHQARGGDHNLFARCGIKARQTAAAEFPLYGLLDRQSCGALRRAVGDRRQY